MRPTISIIGTGKVGTTLARLWAKRGYKIGSLYNRTTENAKQLAQDTGSTIVHALADVVENSDIVFLTVPDDSIETLAHDLRELNWQNKAVIHTSGVASIAKLSVLADSGAMTGSLHPAFPFSDVASAMENLSGATFAIEADHVILKQWLDDLVTVLNGQVINIPLGKKAQYHAALVFASNYTVSLYAIAENLLKDLNAESSAIDNALMVLLQATVDNIRKQGIPDALTGPLSRADTGTIEAHLNVLDDEMLKQTYINLARLSYPILEQRGINSQTIEEIFRDKL